MFTSIEKHLASRFSSAIIFFLPRYVTQSSMRTGVQTYGYYVTTKFSQLGVLPYFLKYEGSMKLNFVLSYPIKFQSFTVTNLFFDFGNTLNVSHSK